ncbi:MAG: hypothetical protein H6595_01575 [Flavobacteriales bacterium]|nr:hypothetical protein [Flavobacteriales bacterium]MCB9166150.1 hypothetical protein [Flavobacteriales bacterium]
MKRQLTSLLFLLPVVLSAQGFTIAVHAPDHEGEHAVLYRYDDLFTLRTVRLDQGVVRSDTTLVLQGQVTGTTKALLMVGDLGAEFYLRNGAHYVLEFPPLPPGTARSINGTDRVDPIFHDLDRLDINALLTDLNERLDAFIAADLATDEVAGMQAVEVLHHNAAGQERQDSVTRPPTLFYTDRLSEARLDSFDLRLHRFYAGVDDPWFQRDLDLGLGGLRSGPQANDKALFERYLGDRRPDYDVPEFVGFFRTVFQDHLLTHPFRTDTRAFLRCVERAEVDSLKAMLMENDMLRGDDRMTELVLIDGLYQEYPGKVLDRKGDLEILERIATASAYPEHRKIAKNMLWDLTAMKPGATLPDLSLVDLDGVRIDPDTVFQGATCLVVTATWCTYCEAEVRALQQLDATYAGVLHHAVLMLDDDREAARAYAVSRNAEGWTWLMTEDPARVRDELRNRTIPAFYLLNDRILARSPAPWPSQGLGAIMHRMQVEAQDRDRIRFGTDAPPPPRRR